MKSDFGADSFCSILGHACGKVIKMHYYQHCYCLHACSCCGLTLLDVQRIYSVIEAHVCHIAAVHALVGLLVRDDAWLQASFSCMSHKHCCMQKLYLLRVK